MNPNNPYHRHQNPSYLLIPNPPVTSSSIHQTQHQHQDQDQDQDHPQQPSSDRDRFPQWTHSETKHLLKIRAELDQTFSQTKRNKPLWEAVAPRMNQHGFSRTSDQCKSKWKNLVTRYKGSEVMEGERSFAYREEMRSIFEERTRRLMDEEGSKAKKAKNEKEKGKRRRVVDHKGGGELLEEALAEFGKKQMETERRWIEAADAREKERRWREEEWRREMAALEEERMEVERRWREREEERHAREEARDERRHELIMAILAKIQEKAGSGL